MKNKKQLALLTLTLGASAALVACSNSSSASSSSSSAAKSDFKAVVVTDTGGVADKSFNQSAWEGLQAWAKENNMVEGTNYTYIQSTSTSDYVTNLTQAVNNGFNMTYAIGFKLGDAMTEVAKNNPDSHFAIVDATVALPNVASITFKDNEASFLAGVAAAKTTSTKKVGFIGGVSGVVIDRFEAGFKAGVQAVDPSIEVSVQYADSFNDAAKGKALASAMYANGIDVIFHASGGTGQGVFTEAKELVVSDPSRNIWVIGVDKDQEAEGKVDDKRNITLTSTLKGVGTAVQKFTQDAMNGNYHGGEAVVYGLTDGGVGLSDGQLSAETKATVKEFTEKIVKGEITVPEKP